MLALQTTGKERTTSEILNPSQIVTVHESRKLVLVEARIARDLRLPPEHGT